MKQFIKNNLVTYNLMSFTGYKGLVLFALLTESPKSYEEVCEYFVNHKYLREKISIDTLRVYINTFKKLGCEIKRTKGEDKVSRYQIISHPFELSMNEDQMQSVIKVYKNLVKNISVEEIFALENFLEKIGEYIKNEEFITSIKKISMLRDIDKKLVEELIECCKRKCQIIINYNSPKSGKKDIEIAVEKLDVSNGKIYLYGIGAEYMEYTGFLLSRIVRINEVKFNRTIPLSNKELNVIYELECEDINLDSNEKLIEQKNGKAIIQAHVNNEFYLKQKLLEYGPSCKILEPEAFKNDFIALLKDMKAGYYCG